MFASLLLAGAAVQAQELPSLPPIAPAPLPASLPGESVVLPAGVTAKFPSGAPAPGKIVRTAAQLPLREKTVEEEIDFVVNIHLPGPERLFERASERQVFEKIRQDARKRPGAPPVHFPEEPVLTREPYMGRQWPLSVAKVEPSYVCHGRLLFEQPNFERYGWDLGVLTPFVNVGTYYYDLVMLPYHVAMEPWQRWDCSAGKCLPGDPVPLRLYREKFSVTGLAAQGFVTGGLSIVFP